MTQAAEIVASRAPDEVGHFRRWLYGVSERVANAAKEGGVLGFGGERVSDDEEAALARIADALGIDRSTRRTGSASGPAATGASHRTGEARGRDGCVA